MVIYTLVHTVAHNCLAAMFEDLTSKGVAGGYNGVAMQFHGLDRWLVEAKEPDTMHPTFNSAEDQFNPPAVSLIVSAHDDFDILIIIIAWDVHNSSWQGLTGASQQSVGKNLGCAQACILVAPYILILGENNLKKLEMTAGTTSLSIGGFVLVVTVRSRLLNNDDSLLQKALLFRWCYYSSPYDSNTLFGTNFSGSLLGKVSCWQFSP